MVAKKNSLKTISEITEKQKKFIDILVENWGSITKVDALLKAGYQSRSRSSASVLAHKLLNPEQTPQLVRYFEHKMQQETDKYEKDKLRRYKIFDKLRDGAEAKGQYTGAINSEYRSGQLAGMFVDKKEITHNTLEGMSREQLEKRLQELESKIGENTTIIEIKPEKNKK